MKTKICPHCDIELVHAIATMSKAGKMNTNQEFIPDVGTDIVNYFISVDKCPKCDYAEIEI